MKDIAIYGAGGFGREIACLIRMINDVQPEWNLIGYFDDGLAKGTSNEYGEVLGDLSTLNGYKTPISIVLAIGNPSVARKVVESITNPLVEFPTLCSPDTVVFDNDNFKIGKGNVITIGCSFSCNVQIGDFNVFNSFIAVGHDTKIGDFNSMMTAVKIAGECNIGDENYFGSSSVVLQQIKIGNRTTIGANSTVMRKTKDGETYIGTPAMKVNL